ncbi:MAG: M67 family metallopeptidase [Acidobacteria bacterium]|nr:M67 family metallopeptidase [Acidobacteriota bacterium]
MASKSLELSGSVVAAIRQHACEAYPDECCGALLGMDGRVSSILTLPNTTEEGARSRFLIRADDYASAERRARDTATELVGFYHSHPDAAARPSQYDLEHAWPFFAYLIVSVRHGAADELRSWRLGDDRSAFHEETVLID